jgi:hypothetical protein
MYRSNGGYNIGYACCGISILTTCIAMIVYGTHNMYNSGYYGMSCSGDNITDMNITNIDNCYTIDFTTCVYNHYICSGDYHITYPLNNTCVNNNTMAFIVNSIINKTEFTCYIDMHHGTIIDNTVVYVTPSKFLIVSWCMVILVLLLFFIHCCIENSRRNIRKEYLVVA